LKKTVGHVSVETFVHATQATEKVLAALAPLALQPEAVTLEESTGHHGNPIVVVHALVTRSRDIAAFFSSPFVSAGRQELSETLDARLDEKGMLFVRADKQDLYRGAYRLNDRGDVRVVVKLLSFPFRRDRVMQHAQELLGR
jgi:RNA binding exosome subunit